MATTKTATAIAYEVVRSAHEVDEWRVEGIDYEKDGQIYLALFSGPDAKKLAEEYARFKNAAAGKS